MVDILCPSIFVMHRHKIGSGIDLVYLDILLSLSDNAKCDQKYKNMHYKGGKNEKMCIVIVRNNMTKNRVRKAV